MKLSIIVPAYNEAERIGPCLESLLSQTLEEPYEIIVVDDGSTDETYETVERYRVAQPEKIVLIRQANRGQGSARNAALEIARGEYIGFADADDEARSDMFEKLLRAAESEGAEVTLCDMLILQGGRELYYDGTGFDHALQLSPSPPNKLLSRSLALSERFPEGLWYEDLEYMYKLFLRAEKIVAVPESLYIYKQRKNSTMFNSNALKNLDIIAVMENVIERAEELGKTEHIDELIISHILHCAINRLAAMKGNEKRDVICHMRAYAHSKLPRLSSSQAYRAMPWKMRLQIRLNYMGLEGVTSLLIRLRGKFK